MQSQKIHLDEVAISLLLLKPCNSLIIGTRSSDLLKLIPPYTQVSKSSKVIIEKIECLAQGEDDRFWASGSFESSETFLILCFSSNLEELMRYSGHSDTIIGLAFNKIQLYSASEDSSVRVWSKSHQSSKLLYEHESPILTFDADFEENFLASADNFCNLQVFSILEKKSVFSLNLDEKVWSLKFLRGQKRLICGDQEGRLLCFDLEKKSEVFRISAHESRVKTLTVSGKIVVAGSFDCVVSIWDWQKREKVCFFESHDDWVRSVVTDGQMVFSVADDSLLFCHSILKTWVDQKEESEVDDLKENKQDCGKINDHRIRNNFDFDFGKIRRGSFRSTQPIKRVFNLLVRKVVDEIGPENWKLLLLIIIGFVFLGEYLLGVNWLIGLPLMSALVLFIFYYFKLTKRKEQPSSV